MSLIALSLIASCSWAHPGADRFIGDPVAAVDNYKDIPAADRGYLKELISKKAYSQLVTITRDSVGDDAYGPLYAMHFGKNKLCQEVDRSAWTDKQTERAMIFCSDNYCVALPTVCGNLSRVDRRKKLAEAARVAPLTREVITFGSAVPMLNLDPMPLETDAPEPAFSFGAPTMKAMSFSSEARLITFYVPPLPPAPPVPEPATWWLLAAGVGVIALRRRHG